MNEKIKVGAKDIYTHKSKPKDIVQPRVFNAIVGISTIIGLIIDMVIVHCYSNVEWVRNMTNGKIILLAIPLLVATICIELLYNHPILSYCLYLLVVCDIGILLAYTVPLYDKIDVEHAIIGTLSITVVFTILGLVFPDIFDKISHLLFIALLGSAGIELVMCLFGFYPTFMDYIVVIIFSGYIGFDWARVKLKNEITGHLTISDAIECALSIYLDIINIFLRLLSISSNKKK